MSSICAWLWQQVSICTCKILTYNCQCLFLNNKIKCQQRRLICFWNSALSLHKNINCPNSIYWPDLAIKTKLGSSLAPSAHTETFETQRRQREKKNCRNSSWKPNFHFNISFWEKKQYNVNILHLFLINRIQHNKNVTLVLIPSLGRQLICSPNVLMSAGRTHLYE